MGTPRWWRCGVTFMGAGADRDDMIHRLRELFGDMPLKDLRFSADPMSEGETMRALDRESAKLAIESDTDEGVTITDLPLIMSPEGVESDQGLLGGLIPAPSIAHPYEQNLWIFPDDHPLAPYERLAAQQQDTPALDSLKELMPGDRALSNDERPMEEDS